MHNSRQTLALGCGLTALFLLGGCDQVQSFVQSFSRPQLAPLAKTDSAQEPSGALGTVLAKVNNDTITLESFDEKLKALKSLSPELNVDTLDAKKAYLNDLVTQELIFQEAKGRGIDKKKEVKDAIEEFRKGVMARQVIVDETKGITVEPAEIEAFYNQYKKDFAEAPEIRASEIVVPTEDMAKEILIALIQGGDFAALAREKSTAASAPNGGDAGFVKKGDKFPKYLELLSTLDVNQNSQIFRGEDSNFYIVKVTEKKGGGVPSLTDVYEQVKNYLLQQKQSQRLNDLTDRLKREAKIEIKEELLR